MPADGAVRAPVLAIDYGRRRIGLALSDALGLTSQPLATLQRTNRRNDLRRLREIVRQHAVRQLVVGRPLNLDGTESDMAAEAARFAARVQRELGLPVELVDERLSTWEAEQIVPARRASRSARRGRSRARSTDAGARCARGDLDHIAAAVILRDYLERAHTRRHTA